VGGHWTAATVYTIDANSFLLDFLRAISQPWHGSDKEGSALYKYRVGRAPLTINFDANFHTDVESTTCMNEQYLGKGGKIEEHLPATSYETVGDSQNMHPMLRHTDSGSLRQVPHAGNIDKLKAFNVPHEQQK